MLAPASAMRVGLAPAMALPLAGAPGMKQVQAWADVGFKLGELHVTLGSLLGGVLLFALFLAGATLLRRLLHRYGERHHGVSPSNLYTVERLAQYLLLAIGLLWALDVAGIPVAKMGVFAGALGVGLGFGLQAIFSNFVCGLILLFDRSLKVGDFVELASGVHGHVREIRIRATLVSTNDDIDILVPNAEFVTGQVVNWTLREVARRQKIPFRVPHGSDKQQVKAAALEAAAAVPFTLSMDGPRQPQVWLTEFGESALHFALVVWLNAEATRRVGAVIAAYNWALHDALQQHGIAMPFPQRDVHVRSWVDAGTSGAAGADAPPAAAAHGPGDGGNDAVRDVRRAIAEDNRNTSPSQDPDAR